MMSSACEDCVPGVSAAAGDRHGGAHVGRQIGGSLGDQFQQAAGEKFHKRIRNLL